MRLPEKLLFGVALLCVAALALSRIGTTVEYHDVFRAAYKLLGGALIVMLVYAFWPTRKT